MPVYELVISEEYAQKPVRRAAMGALGLSSGQFKRAKFHGLITLDGTPVKADARLCAGQTLRLEIPEVENTLPEPFDIPFEILFEDEHFRIIDKPAPLPTASSSKQDGPTLENALFHRLGCPADFVYRPVNRLDKGTSGLMLAANTAHAQHLLQQMLHSDGFVREYLAVVDGAPPADEGVIDLPIGKCDGATVKREVRPDGKEARTFYRVMQRGRRSLVRLRLDTGRTHQIRVHMAAMGCPVTGDFLYGTETGELPGRFALHSAYVRVVHPVTGQVIERESELPGELGQLLKIFT
ncbi:MAG: RluA family pseudouridine synthase [Clostridia bacterium]|nr:RluA family pseudouridine synthase [Clostridia bacterium]